MPECLFGFDWCGIDWESVNMEFARSLGTDWTHPQRPLAIVSRSTKEQRLYCCSLCAEHRDGER